MNLLHPSYSLLFILLITIIPGVFLYLFALASQNAVDPFLYRHADTVEVFCLDSLGMSTCFVGDTPPSISPIYPDPIPQ